MMTPEQIERTIEFLLGNQAAHDARLAELEVAVKTTNDSVKNLSDAVEDLRGTTSSMLTEFRAGFEVLIILSEQTMTSVKQIAEAEVRTIKRMDSIENRLGQLESTNP